MVEKPKKKRISLKKMVGIEMMGIFQNIAWTVAGMQQKKTNYAKQKKAVSDIITELQEVNRKIGRLVLKEKIKRKIKKKKK